MAFAPRLYAVVDNTAPAAAHRKNVAELRADKLAELKAKKAIDRANSVLDRLEARRVIYKSQIAALKRRDELAAARFERLENEILTRMARACVDRADGFQSRFQARPAPAALDVFDESQIPGEYLREKVSSAPDKNAIKAALARGEEIGGVRLTQKVLLVRT